MLKKWVLAASAMIPIYALASYSPLLVNGGFEDPAILGDGQTDILPGESKMIRVNPSDPFYFEGIAGVNGWANRILDEGWSDQGLSILDQLAPVEGTRYSFINNWERKFSQTVSKILQEGDLIEGHIYIGSSVADARSGRAFLIAGEMDPLFLDELAVGSRVLVSKQAATSYWNWNTPDQIIPDIGWTRVDLCYLVQAGDSAIGKPLTFAFQTDVESVGRVYFDDADLRVTATPEVPTGIMIGVAVISLGLVKKRW